MAEQITRRHVNGGALKIGTEVHVSADSFADESTVIEGKSCVLESSAMRVSVIDSQVYKSSLLHCIVRGSTVADSSIQMMVLNDCILHKVLSDRPTSITLTDVVAENCELYGNWSLEGNFRIHEGVWHRSPRTQRITGENGVDTGITECKPGYAMMACWCKPISSWLHAGPRLGRLHKWTEEQIETARLFYQQLLDEPLEM